MQRLQHRQTSTLRALAGFKDPVSMIDLTYPGVVRVLAEHGYVRVSVEITDKGRAQVEQDERRD